MKNKIPEGSMVNVKSPLDSLDFDLQLDNECEKMTCGTKNFNNIRSENKEFKDLRI